MLKKTIIQQIDNIEINYISRMKSDYQIFKSNIENWQKYIKIIKNDEMKKKKYCPLNNLVNLSSQNEKIMESSHYKYFLEEISVRGKDIDEKIEVSKSLDVENISQEINKQKSNFIAQKILESIEIQKKTEEMERIKSNFET